MSISAEGCLGGSSPLHPPPGADLFCSANVPAKTFPTKEESPPWHPQALRPCPRRGGTYRPAPAPHCPLRAPTGYLPLPAVGLDQGPSPPSSRTFLSIAGSLMRELHRHTPVATGLAELQPPPPAAHAGSRGPPAALSSPAWSTSQAQQLLSSLPGGSPGSQSLEGKRVGRCELWQLSKGPPKSPAVEGPGSPGAQALPPSSTAGQGSLQSIKREPGKPASPCSESPPLDTLRVCSSSS